MADDPPNAFSVPQYSGAQATADCAQREVERHRAVVREIWNRGFRWPGQVAAEMNRLAVPSHSGRPWKSGAVADLLKRLHFDRKATERQEAEALEGVVEELWSEGIQTRPQIMAALIERSIWPIGGGHWTEDKVRRLLEYVAGDCMLDGTPRLRGDGMRLVDGFPMMAEPEPFSGTPPPNESERPAELKTTEQ
ncbi:hypothetical protein [Methylobacterium sp. GC_Met_2]|uniref:hypothetical protein n=1 Tax=Methylobacterium sp. GC_Met_2 TaxID=2937376 RepID=UPI00226B90D5|nr:hypothetical protein [Methylobacterium sp. GC_Met_2]